jgi:hypothetical protein
MKIGLSLSNCVLDILSGEVGENSFTAIIGNSMFETPEQAIESYSTTYWRDFSYGKVESVVQRIWPKVIQFRLLGGPFQKWTHHTGSDDPWIEVYSWPDLFSILDDRNAKCDPFYVRIFSKDS